MTATLDSDAGVLRGIDVVLGREVTLRAGVAADGILCAVGGPSTTVDSRGGAC